MNHYSVGTTKTGLIQLTFGNSEQAKELFRGVMSALVSVNLSIEPAPVVSLPESDKTGGSSAETRARKRNRETSPGRKTPNKESTRKRLLMAEDRRMSRMGEKERSMFDERNRCTDAVSEYTKEKFGEEAGEKIESSSYRELYGDFYRETGYRAKVKSPLRELGIYAESYLNTFITDGKGAEFHSFVQTKIRRLKLYSVDGGVQSYKEATRHELSRTK